MSAGGWPDWQQSMDENVERVDEGFRILARIVARDWARRHFPREYAGNVADDETVNQKSPIETVPTI